MSSHPTTAAHTEDSVSATRRATLVVAPGLLLVGVLLMMTPDAWTVSHLVFLAGCLGMLPAGVVLHTLLAGAPEWLRRVGLTLTVMGALALAGEFVIDFVVMRLAGGDSQVAGPMFDRIQGSPTLGLVFYNAGPSLLFTGLAVSGAALIARSGRQHLPGWMLVVGAGLMGTGRVVGSRPVEVVALAVVLGGLALVARSSAGGQLPCATSDRLRPVPPLRWVLGASVILVGGLVLSTALPALATTHEQVRLPVKHKQLHLVLSGGDVVLRRGTGEDLVVSRTTRRGTSEPRVLETSGADGVRIEADCSGPLNWSCEVSYDVEVPDGLDLDVEIGAGSLTAHDLVIGALRLQVASGDVSLTDATASAAVVVEVASGDLGLDFMAPPRSVVATVSSGHIEIGLPPGSYDVDAETASGDERVEVPVDPTSARLIRAHTSHGDIEVFANDSR